MELVTRYSYPALRYTDDQFDPDVVKPVPITRDEWIQLHDDIYKGK